MFKYLKYLFNHKKYVFIYGLKLGVNPLQLLIHDWSKFLWDEFSAYNDYFYGEFLSWDEAKYSGYITYRNTKEGVKQAFDEAWLKHQHRNPHHWQHWVLREDSGETIALPMPRKYYLEMVADWAGAGYAITGKLEVGEWYKANKDKMILHPDTRKNVEFEILMLYKLIEFQEIVHG